MVRRGRALVQAYEAEKQAEWESVKPKSKPIIINPPNESWIDRGIDGLRYGKCHTIPPSSFHIGQRVTFSGGNGMIVGINGEGKLGVSFIFPAGTLWIKEASGQDGVLIPKDPHDCRLEEEHFPSPQTLANSPMLTPAREFSSSEQTLASTWNMVILHNLELRSHTHYTTQREWEKENTFIIDVPVKIEKGLGNDIAAAINNALYQGATYLLDNNAILVKPPVNLIPSDPFAVHIQFTTIPGWNLVTTT